MTTVINTNVPAIIAKSNMDRVQRELESSINKLSSGQRINKAADDAAGMAVANRMESQIRGLTMAIRHGKDGQNLVDTADGAQIEISNMLQRLRELAVQAVNDTNGSTDRTYLQAEVTSLLNEIDRVSTQTVYNNKVLLDGSLNGKIQVGTEAGQDISFSIDSIGTDSIGDGVSMLDSIDVTTSADASAALDTISGAIEQVAGQRASYGAMQNRLEYTVSNLLNVAEFTTAARSRIEDADFAGESARLSKAQVLQQTGTAMLAQANAASQLALQLIR